MRCMNGLVIDAGWFDFCGPVDGEAQLSNCYSFFAKDFSAGTGEYALYGYRYSRSKYRVETCWLNWSLGP